MDALKNNIAFIKYSKSKKEQSITILLFKGDQKYFIGQIHRIYDQILKIYSYKATDIEGNQVFTDTKELSALKKKFIDYGETLIQFNKKEQFFEREGEYDTSLRDTELEKIREKNLYKNRRRILQR